MIYLGSIHNKKIVATVSVMSAFSLRVVGVAEALASESDKTYAAALASAPGEQG